jgi:hypothetical protein
MTKLKGDIFKYHSDKLGLLWTNDQWQTVMDAMDEYAQQEVKNIVVQADVSSMYCGCQQSQCYLINGSYICATCNRPIGK